MTGTISPEVLAERERCAKIAEEFKPVYESFSCEGKRIVRCDEIKTLKNLAEKIRRGE